MGYKEALQQGRLLNFVEIVNLLAGENDLKYSIPEALSKMMGDNILYMRSEVDNMIEDIVIDNGNGTYFSVGDEAEGDYFMYKLRDIAEKMYRDGVL